MGIQIINVLRAAAIAAVAGLGLAGGAAAQPAFDADQVVGVWEGYEVAGGYSIGTESSVRTRGVISPALPV